MTEVVYRPEHVPETNEGNAPPEGKYEIEYDFFDFRLTFFKKS